MHTDFLEKALVGCLLGTALGDATGLVVEGLSPRKIQKRFPHLDGPSLFFHRGMISDDTEHHCLVAQALLSSAGDADLFRRHFAHHLRFWLLALPAGVGFATLRSILKLWFGGKKGVFSAGNGPAMRSAILGVYFRDDLSKMKQFVRISTELTHTDPKAFLGAFAVALAASFSSKKEPFSPEQYFQALAAALKDDPSEEFLKLMQQIQQGLEQNQSLEMFAQTLGLSKGISGYIYHTLPIVLYAWLDPNTDAYQKKILNIIALGGDTDTTAAILGGILGSGIGKEGLPQEWLERLFEWPRTPQWIEKLGRALATSDSTKIPSCSFFALLFRNIFFMIVVLGHGFRRLFPPY